MAAVVAEIGGWLVRAWRSEWRWPLVAALMLAVTIEVPFALAASHRMEGLEFGGMLWSLTDPPQYYSAMRQGASTPGFLIYDRFTQEPHAPAPLYLLYIALGKLAWLTGADVEATFLVASRVARLGLLLAAYVAAGLLGPGRAMRRTGYILIALSSGLAATLLVVKAATDLPLPLSALEREYPELNTMLVTLTAPHLMLGLALLLLAGRLYADCWDRPPGWRRVSLAVVVLMLGLVDPFAVASFVPVVAAHGLVMAGLRRRLDVPGHSAAAVALVAATPIIALNAVTFTFDPFWSATYSRQNVLPAPAMTDVLLAFGLLVPLALLGLPELVRRPSPGRLLVVIWIVTALVMMHAPAPPQRRFALGLHPMIALAATYGTLELMRRLKGLQSPGQRLLRLPITIVVVQALFGTSVFTYVVALMVGLAPTLGYPLADLSSFDRSPYQPPAVQAAADWLAAHESPDHVVLASTLSGNYIAGKAPGRVYVGHQVATLGFSAKVDDVRWFFSAPLDDDRRAFLTANRIRFVVYGPHERSLANGNVVPRAAGAVFSTGDVEIFDADALTTPAGTSGGSAR